MKYYIKIALQHYAMGLIIPIAIVWKLQNGLSLPQAVLTESLVLFVIAIADLPAGFLANKINNKRSLVLGALLHVVGMGLLAIGSSLPVFMCAAVVSGLAWACISGADEAYIHDDFIEQEDDYKKVFATSTIVDEAATIGGMVATSALLYAGVGLRWLFIGATLLLLLHLVYAYVFLPASQKLPAIHPARATKFLASGLIKNREVVALIPLMAAFAVVYEAARPLWQPHMQQIGIDVVSFGIIFALLKCASLIGSVVARYKDLQLKGMLLIFAVMLVALLSFGASIKAVSIFALCAYLFTENYFRVYMSSLLNKVITANRAALLSLGSVIRNAAGALIIALTSAVSGSAIFIALLIVVIIKVPAIVYILRAQARIAAG